MCHAAHAGRQAGGGDGVIQAARRTVKHIRVARCAEAAHLVDIAAAGQVENRVFLRVGVEVANQQRVIVATRRLQLRDERAQAQHLRLALQVPAALAITRVHIARCIGIRRQRAGTFRFQVVHNQRETFAVGQAKALRQRGPVVDGVDITDGRSQWAELGGLVNHGDTDGVRASALGG